VLTSPHPAAAAFDARQPFAVHRWPAPVLLPTPGLVAEVRRLAGAVGARLVVLDPVLPLGHVGPRLGLPYAVVAHGAEISVPARLPGIRGLLRTVLAGAAHVVAASRWVLGEVEALVGRPVPATVLSGVDVERFRPLEAAERRQERRRLGIDDGDLLVVGVSRLVPRKGFDVLVAAAHLMAGEHPELRVVVGGQGRDRRRLERLVGRTGAPVRLLGSIDHDLLPRVVGAADIVAVPCRQRWGGLEQEGFGLVFLEAAACGVAQVAGRSGGAAEAVVHGETGLVVAAPDDPEAVAGALRALARDPARRAALGRAARQRAVTELSYPRMAARLEAALAGSPRAAP